MYRGLSKTRVAGQNDNAARAGEDSAAGTALSSLDDFKRASLPSRIGDREPLSSYYAGMIYLASRSPRRAELLRQIGVEFTVHACDIDETRRASESPVEYVCRMATSKARVAAEQLSGSQPVVVLAADTTIALDGATIGKPADQTQCCSILQQLSARQHLVLSAVALAIQGDVRLRLSQNRVSFRALSKQEIESYCATGEPMDKAGAYAIQGKAALFVDHLEGSYSAVMGLPLYETAELLANADITIF
jgi:septum formation protein